MYIGRVDVNVDLDMLIKDLMLDPAFKDIIVQGDEYGFVTPWYKGSALTVPLTKEQCYWFLSGWMVYSLEHLCRE